MKLKTIVLLAISMLMVALSAAAEEGLSIAVLGEVTVQRGDKSLPLKRGVSVQVGDRIRTGDGASAQLRMSDGSILAIPQKSELEITKYRFSDDKPEGGEARFSLLKGGLRTLTGKIGVHARPNYEVKTLVATIGIRGTHFRLQLCAKDCESEGVQAKDGLYGGVTEGRIAITNQVGETEFGMDEYFFLADANAKPELLPGPPSLLNDRLASLSASRRIGSTGAVDTTPDLTASGVAPRVFEQSTLATSATEMRPIEGRIAPESLAHIQPVQPGSGGFVSVGGSGVIRGQIVWMTDADIDLHMLAPTGGGVYYGSRTLPLSDTATAQLDHDNLGGIIDVAPDSRVENIIVTGSQIPTGNYDFFAHSFSGNNNGLPTNVQIRVSGDSNQTSQTDTVSLANGQNSNTYRVNYQGPSIAPQYQTILP